MKRKFDFGTTPPEPMFAKHSFGCNTIDLIEGEQL